MAVKVYQTKPCLIEAIQWDGHNEDEIKKWAGDDVQFIDSLYDGQRILTIHTLEGDMIGSVNDYIIKGLKGEFYPCKPDVFVKKYEEINHE